MYQVLARKYRPRNFIELVGQNHVSRALTSALERGRLHHAYLFTGTRGVGKTTIARILAKCLNCETGVTSTPCEVCPTCTAVNEGRFIDLIEIDAASRTKVEDTRELLDNVPYAPTQGRFKVYLIDEVHMLSTHSFNALLKTLEEPPEHVKFLFATTDPQKLPITVISRCLQFTLRPLSVDEITNHLRVLLQQENIEAEQDAIWQIAESAQGSLRDALSLTDQAIAYGQGTIAHQDVKEMLGLIDRTIIYDLILAIHQNQKSRVSELLIQFRQQALDVSLVMDQLISTLHELALLQYLPDLSLKYSAEVNQKIMQLSGMIAAQDLQLYYQIACKGRADLQLAVTQEQGFEMCVLRLLAFRPLQANEILVRPDQTVQVQPTHENAIEQPAIAAPIQSESKQVDSSARSTAVEHVKSSSFELSDDFPLDDDSDESLNQFDEKSIDEPSSDDFLEDIAEADATKELAQSEITEAEALNVESSEQIIFDPEQDGLFGLDAVPDEVDQLQKDLDENDGLHDFETVEEPQHIQNANEQFEPLEHTENLSVDNIQSSHSDVQSGLMPKDILALPKPEMQGEWNVEKWEYWFRNSELSPAVQELAQHGLMKGQIDALSTFVIPKKYEQLLVQLQHVLEGVLKHQYPNTRFEVQFNEVDEITPYQLQQVRRDRAYQRANELLQNEPAVKSLIQQFDGELQNIELK